MGTSQIKSEVPAVRRHRYREQYGVIVVCIDEAEQQAVYEELRGRGWKLRVVVT